MLTAAVSDGEVSSAVERQGEEQPIADVPPLTTEFAAFEHAKENIVPLRQGRSAAALASLFGPRSPGTSTSSSTDIGEVLRAGHAAFNAELEEIDELDDPLDVYARYISWTVENYPQGNSRASNLVPLLEQATRGFHDDARYRNDPRYLKMWLLYAKNVQCPKDIYAYLMSNGIGTDLAAYYEDYAECLEREGSNERADEVYRLGINRKARPLERLSRRYKEFQYRIVHTAHEEDAPTFSENDPSRADRSVLGQKHHPMSSRSFHTNVALPSEFPAPPRPVANASNIHVFVDPDGTAEVASRRCENSTRWKDLGTEQSRRKENIQTATAWQGSKLPQNVTGGPPPRPRPSEAFHVYRDDPNESRGEVDALPGNEQQALQELKTETEASRLTKDPLRNFHSGHAAVPASCPSPKSTSTAHRASHLPDQPTRAANPPVNRKVTESLRVNLDLVYANGQEYQFEEIRLMAMGPIDLSAPEVPPWSRTVDMEKVREEARHEEERCRRDLDEHERLARVDTLVRETKVPIGEEKTIGKLGREMDAERLRLEPEAEISNREKEGGARKTPAEDLDTRNHENAAFTNKIADGKHGRNAQLEDMSCRSNAGPMRTGTERAEASQRSATAEKDFTEVTNVEDKGKLPASPTINTKAALADIMEMLSQPLKSEREEDSYRRADRLPAANHDENKPVFKQVSANSAVAAPSVNQELSSRVPSGLKCTHSSSASSGMSFTVFRDEGNDSGGLAPAVAGTSGTATPFIGNRLPLQERQGDIERDFVLQAVSTSVSDKPESDFGSDCDGDDDRDSGALSAHSGDVQGRVFDTCRDASEVFTENIELDERGKPIYTMTVECTQNTGIYHSTPHSCNIENGEAVAAGDRTFTATGARLERFQQETSGPAFVPGDTCRSRPSPNFGVMTPILERSIEQSMTTDQSGDVAADSNNPAKSLFRDERSLLGKVSTADARPHRFEIVGSAADTYDGLKLIAGSKDLTNLPSRDRAPTPPKPNTLLMPPSPCRPHDAILIEGFLASLRPPLAEYDGFADMTENKCPIPLDLQRTTKRSISQQNRRSGYLPGSDVSTDLGLVLGRGNKQRQLLITRKLGTGGYGTIYLATDVAASEEDALAGLAVLNLDPDVVGRCRQRDSTLCAAKLQVPPSPWEFYVLRQLHRRIRDRGGSRQLLASVVYPTELFVYEDASVLVMDYHDQGTLLDAVNVCSGLVLSGTSSGMDELLAIFFTIELLRIIETVHTCGVLHADIKPDNLLLRLEEPEDGVWASQYDPSGGGGWDSKGLILIDFGRAVDLAAFDRPGRTMRFLADWEVDDLDCPEAQRGEPWRYEEDYYGVANVVYCLLHGRYLEVVAADNDGSQTSLCPAAPYRRYWRADLWQQLFDILLNSRKYDHEDVESAQPPLAGRLKNVRQGFEEHLRGSCNRGGKSLKSLLKQLEMRVADRRGCQR